MCSRILPAVLGILAFLFTTTCSAQIGLGVELKQYGTLGSFRSAPGIRLHVDQVLSEKWIFQYGVGWAFLRKHRSMRGVARDTTISLPEITLAFTEKYDLFDLSVGAQYHITGDWREGGWFVSGRGLLGAGYRSHAIGDFDPERYRTAWIQALDDFVIICLATPLGIGYHFGFQRFHVMASAEVIPLVTAQGQYGVDGGIGRSFTLGFRYWWSSPL